MLKLSDLAARGDFDAGPLHVSPARRLIEGPAGSASVEPIVMKVFLLLLDAAGNVVTRDELFGSAWGGVFVGDDSLNRAIARVRKIAGETAPGLFEIETIPRTGYRLRGPILDHLDAPAEASPERLGAFSRRTIIGTGAASAVALGGAAWWLTTRASDQRRFEELLKRGGESLEYGDGSVQSTNLLRQAAAIRPSDPEAQGLLAYALVANVASVEKGPSGTSMKAAQEAADASLRANPNNPEARLARILLERATLDLAATEDRLRGVLATAPDNILAMRSLWNLLQSAGRSRDALALVERAVGVRPLAAANNYPLAQLLWITGRTAEADRIIDRAMQAWPTHRYVRFARFTIFAFTGRPRAALAMLEDPERRPQHFSPGLIALWRRTLPVFDQPSPAGIADVRDAYLGAVRRDPGFGSQAVLPLCALGEVDAAFEIANNLFVFRAQNALTPAKSRGSPAGSTAWRFTPWLFTPPAASFRADPRFVELCDGIGLTEYWRARGIRPDYQLA